VYDLPQPTASLLAELSDNGKYHRRNICRLYLPCTSDSLDQNISN
jgi:hypothetical protein